MTEECARLAIVGYRSFSDYNYFASCVDDYIAGNRSLKIIEIVSGGAKGVDQLAERYADEHQIPLRIYSAEWSTYGKSAGLRRNAQIVEHASHVLAFLHEKSRGTRNTIRLAQQAGKPVKIVALA